MVCLVCYEDVQTINLKCDCQYCYECLIKYTKVNDEQKCMSCQSKQDWVSITQQTQYEPILQEILLKKYIQKQGDIYQCPTNGCKFAGFIGNKKQFICCPLCQNVWRTQGYNKLNTYLTGITKFIHTSNCPKCNVTIEKNGGCSEMTCQSCKYKFCWYCSNGIAYHNSYDCWLNLITNLFIIIYMILCLSYSIGLLQLIIYLSILGVKAFLYFGASIILPPLFLAICSAFLYYQFTSLYNINIYQNFKNSQIKGILLAIVGYIIYYSIENLLELDIQNMIEITIFEFVIVGVGFYLKRK
ncbi:hypothetical protein pb186bvf_015183 [Paramecium bursaria]